MLYALYFIVPALAFYVPIRNDHVGWKDIAVFGPFNYLGFAFPLLLWLFIAHSNKASRTKLHAGLLGATLPLIGLTVTFECCIKNENAMGWLLYYPLAFIGVTVFVWFASKIDHARQKSA